MYSQYLRLGLPVSASDNDVIRAARRLILKRHRHDPDKRAARHRFYAQMLTYHAKAGDLFDRIARGAI